ncbi:MAG: hypothetical protein M3N46_01695 [Actinomycetota bacterium]|nr:hypothetical protein [Actinomycetota bacterium]
MGSLHYDGREFELEDRVLAHLQIIISTKLRRKECFFVTWVQPQERGSGRHTIWIDNGVALHIFFGGSRVPSINRVWIDDMMASAGRTTGLLIGDEPGE